MNPTPVHTDPSADGAVDFEHYRAAAQALPAGEVQRWYGVPSRIQDNVARGAQAVLAQRPHLAAQLPQANWPLVEQAERYARAASYGFAVADRTVAAQPEVAFADLRDQVSADRKQFLAALTFLASTGKIDAAQVEAIATGKGLRDLGEDVLAACEHLGGHGLVEAAALTTARQRATSYLERLRPAGRKGDFGKKGEAASAADLRDRMFTLTLRAYAEVWRVGAWQWGQNVAEHVPSLSAQRV